MIIFDNTQYRWLLLSLLYFTIETKQEIIKNILKFYSMEQEITHYSRDKLHVGQITVRESAHSTK